MFSKLNILRHSLISKLILAVGLTLLVSMTAWSYYAIDHQKKTAMNNIVEATERLSTTVKLGAHYAMTLNSRDDIKQIINNISKQPDIEHIRIYNKKGRIKFSNRSEEIEHRTNILAEACIVCHRARPPLVDLSLEQRTRIYSSPSGERFLAILSPIYNEPGCSAARCHFHPADKKILGALDLAVSLEETDQEMAALTRRTFGAAALVILIASTAIIVIILMFVRRPMTRLIDGTRQIARGRDFSGIKVNQDDEMGQLAGAINQMGREIIDKQKELNKQRDEYLNLFETVPCIITVQDRNYKLLKYNKEFKEKFRPRPGDYCYQAYKGLSEKCPVCPMEKTYLDGKHHFTEETGYKQDGSPRHWVVRTSPIYDRDGNITACMEVCLDITQRKKLEVDLEISEKKYYAIFNNIPNPVFVLDQDNLTVVDCNDSVTGVYGFSKSEIIDHSFLELFLASEREQYWEILKNSAEIDQVRQLTRNGLPIYVAVRISPSEYPGKKVLLITTSDITKRLEAEQQLIQASKLATLGEMATGVAHELNQPLTVIKTASSFFIRKIDRDEPISREILKSLAGEIKTHVDRSTRIIDHMREFGRKAEENLELVQVDRAMKKAFEFFSQQLKLREIEVNWDIEPGLPRIMADPIRMEQVFMNLLINARDAIEEQWDLDPRPGGKKIFIKARKNGPQIVIRVEDNGAGIPEAVADKIFEPFFTTKEVGKGTGLGLSLSYRFIQDCRGKIRARPADSGGAVFFIEFPIPEEEQ